MCCSSHLFCGTSAQPIGIVKINLKKGRRTCELECVCEEGGYCSVWVGGCGEGGVSLRVQWLTLHHKTESVLQQRKPSHAREEEREELYHC